MIGAILGDIIGSPFEMGKMILSEKKLSPLFYDNISEFTDDTVLTVATADALLTNTPYEKKYVEWFKKYPNRGYGNGFYNWANSGGNSVRNSHGNGAAMRVSPLLFHLPSGKLVDALRWIDIEAEKTIKWTHNCNESDIGTKALLTSMLLAHNKRGKEDIKSVIESVFDYNLNYSIDDIRRSWQKRDVRCSITVPQAIICFLHSNSIESCILNAIWAGGDCDTIANMAASIGEQFYGLDSINKSLILEIKSRLPTEMWEIIKKTYNGKLNKYDK